MVVTHPAIKVVTDACCRVKVLENGEMDKIGKSACAYILLNADDKIVSQGTYYIGEVSPSQAEYFGLIYGLNAAVEYTRYGIEVWMDSEIVIRQMTGKYCIKSENIKNLFDQVKMLEMRFILPVKYYHHSRGSFWARQVDNLANGLFSKIHTG